MSRSQKSGALLAGVILIAIGAIFLAENFYPSISFWRLLSRYWPVILILVGVKKLHSYMTWEEETTAAGPTTYVPPVPDAGMKQE
jgi:hypothetical protein